MQALKVPHLHLHTYQNLREKSVEKSRRGGGREGRKGVTPRRMHVVGEFNSMGIGMLPSGGVVFSSLEKW